MVKEIEAPLGGKKRGKKEGVNRHEKQIAKKLGGYAQPASGAMDHAKGDIKLKNFLLDSKETIRESITIKGLDLTKISREAFEIGKKPGLFLTIEGVPHTTPKEWVLIDAEVFAEMLERGQDDS